MIQWKPLNGEVMPTTPDYYTLLKTRMNSTWGLSNWNVTRRAITYGSRDSWCGWRAITWTPNTMEMFIEARGLTQVTRSFGIYPRIDAVAITKGTVVGGDQILDSPSVYYSVYGVRDQYYPGSSTLIWRELDLKRLTAFQASFGTTTWSKTRGTDERYRTKFYLDTYVRSAQLTKDNDSTTATWAAIFADPPYPLEAEFRAASNPVQGLFVIDHSMNSTPLVRHDKTTVSYIEHVPVHCVTVDSTSCSGSALQWKMIAELRYVVETYPTGSMRLLDTQRSHDVDLGGMMLYDTEFTMVYERAATV